MKWFEPDLTPVPWELRAGDNYFIEAAGYPKEFPHRFKHDDLGDCVAYIGNRTGDFGEANAKFIVKAVNCHDSLLEACKKARKVMRENSTPIDEWDDTFKSLTAAIAKAEAEPS